MNSNPKLSYAIAAILSGSTAGLAHAAPHFLRRALKLLDIPDDGLVTLDRGGELRAFR